MSNYIGLDIGGSHLSIGLVKKENGKTTLNSFSTTPIDSSKATVSVLEILLEEIKDFVSENNVESLSGIGISMPGPFDYVKGISKINNLNKYDALFGLNLKYSLANRLWDTFKIIGDEISLINDADAFLEGVLKKEKWNNEKVLGITLGTGFGSAANPGEHIQLKDDSKSTKYLFNTQFKKGVAEEYFSTKWFVDQYNQRNKNGAGVENVKQIASKFKTDNDAKLVFEEFGRNLGEFLADKVRLDYYDKVVIGGGIANSNKLFEKSLAEYLPNSEKVKYIDDTSVLAIQGAVENCIAKIKKDSKEYRNTTQNLLPVEKPASNHQGYDIYPTFEIGDSLINTGHDTLADWIIGKDTVIIDGYVGVAWEKFVALLNDQLKEKGQKVNWYSITAALNDEECINDMITPFLGGDDPIFGHRYPGILSDFFDSDKLKKISPDSDGIDIIYGSGAALLDNDESRSLIYLDVPKNEIQYRSRAGSIYNLGSTKKATPKEQYKRFYFVDWPVLNSHKREVLADVDVIVDEQRINEITWINGEDFRDGLVEMSKNTVRARPWFESGVWGGEWIQDKIEGLNTDVPNYAWSFELIVPENGIIMESSNKMLEVSFDYLMYQDNQAVLGDVADLFGYEFPIRFDFLDTFNGQNLSLQCHPNEGYIYKNFGEKFTQDETYYMLDCGEDAEVYLGFKEGVDKDEFRSDLEQSYEKNTAVDVEKYVQTFSASKHDLFLIPSETVHCSGKNNLVLEISNTPYIFTFKMYDWLRLDLDGNPRPINIERAFENLDFRRQGKKVEEEFVSTPKLLAEDEGWKIENLPTHPNHFYSIHRMEVESSLNVSTEGQCHILSLVEGQSIIVKTNNRQQKICYAETFVIPAAAESYEIINEGDEPVKVIKAFVKDEDQIKIKPYKQSVNVIRD